MLESIFVVLFVVVLIALGIFVFKAFLKIIIATIILFLLILAGNRMFGNDWLKEKEEVQETSSSSRDFI